MSRFDPPTNEPDYDRYEPKPFEDIDVPDFDEPDPIVDPAEHAAHDVIDALSRLEKEIVQATDVDRMLSLWAMLKRVSTACLETSDKAAAKTDSLMERRR